jgi:hypothetical protein
MAIGLGVKFRYFEEIYDVLLLLTINSLSCCQLAALTILALEGITILK